MGALDRLKNIASGGTATATPPAKPAAATKSVAAAADPNKGAAFASAAADGWASGKAPWAFDDCKGCRGTGWSSMGQPCRPCAARADQTDGKPVLALYETRASEGGVPIFRLRADAINGSLPPDNPTQTTAVPEESAVVEEAKKPRGRPKGALNKVKEEPVADAEATEIAAKPASQAPTVPGTSTVTLLLNTYMFDNAPEASVNMFTLTDLLYNGSWGERVFKELGKEHYLECDPFKRRELVQVIAEELMATLPPFSFLSISTDNVEEREIWRALQVHALYTLRGM